MPETDRNKTVPGTCEIQTFTHEHSARNGPEDLEADSRGLVRC